MSEDFSAMTDLLVQIEETEQLVADLEDDVQYIETCRHLPNGHPDHQDQSRLAPAKARLSAAKRALDRLRLQLRDQDLDQFFRTVPFIARFTVRRMLGSATH